MEQQLPLTVLQMSVKYNCSPELVRTFARNNGVPCEQEFSRTKVYKFYPKHEELFSGRDKKRGIRHYSFVCFVRHFAKGEPEILFFRSMNQAFFHAVRSGSFFSRYTPGSRRHERLLKRLDGAALAAAQKTANAAGFSGSLCELRLPGDPSVFFFDFHNNASRAEAARRYFSHGCLRATAVSQKTQEQPEAFCQRILAENAPSALSLQKLKRHIIPDGA